MKNSLVKYILLFSLFLPNLSYDQILAVKKNRILSKNVSVNYKLRRKMKSKISANFKMKREKVNFRMKRKQNCGTKGLIRKYWPYGLLVPGVPSASYLTYKLFSSECVQSNRVILPNEFTPKQEGAWWCWLACLCGLLKAQDIKTPEENEITQEWMFEKIFKKRPPKSYGSRKQGGASVCWESSRLIEFINSLSISCCYKYAEAYCSIYPENPKITALNVEKIILDFYEKTGKRPFSTDIDKPISSSIGHAVNVSKIYERQGENWLVYEDPLSGVQSERKLKDWCKNYVKFHADKFGGNEKHVSFFMFSLAKPDCELYDCTILRAQDQNNKENVTIQEKELC